MQQWRTETEAGERRTQDWRFIARQPILDRSRSTFGYELLARSSWANFFFDEAEQSSKGVLDNALAFGLHSLVGNTVPFLNCTRQLVLSGSLHLLPHSTVLELLETIEVDSELVGACHKLKEAGFRLALDDFDFSAQWDPLLPLVDFIKVDVRISPAPHRTKLLAHWRSSTKLMLAEKVETEQEYRTLLDEGFHLFQGYFFTHPVVVGRPPTPALVGHLQLITLLRRPELPLEETLDLIRRESSLAIRLLRIANSARFSRGEVIADLKTAYLHVGEEQFRKLALFVLGTALYGSQPLELHRTVLVYSRFCELMASVLDIKPGEMFVFGMLFIVKDVLHIDVGTLFDQRVLKRSIADALSGIDVAPLSNLIECAAALNSGDWPRLATAADALQIPVDKTAGCFREAQQWADQILQVAAV